MVTCKAVIRNSAGIHCRPSSVILKELQGYEGVVELQANGAKVMLKSIMDLLGLGLCCGTEIQLSVSGPDEENVLNRLKVLFETEYDFPNAQGG